MDSIICTAVNDVFVMDAWGKDQNADEIIMLADGIGEFASAMGLDQDLSGIQFRQAQPALRHDRQRRQDRAAEHRRKRH